MTTIISVRRNGNVVIGSDGQETVSGIIVKNNVRKIRCIYYNKIITGYTGNTTDAFILFKILENELENYKGNLIETSLAISKYWKKNNILMNSKNSLAMIDKNISIFINKNGNIIQPGSNVIAIGSGGSYAYSAAIALLENTNLSAYNIVKKVLNIVSDICIYTNKFQNIKILKSLI